MKEWKGMSDGVPPVGHVCETYRPVKRKWVEVKIIGCHPVANGTLACIDDDYDLFWAYEFRPVRSETDKAVEEMRRSIASHPDAPTFYHALYRDGWRKTEEAE